MQNNSNKLLLIGNALAGTALLLAVRQITPDGAFTGSTQAVSWLMVSPALILFLTLFTAFYMGMIRLWVFLVVGVVVAGLTVVIWG